MCWAVPGIVVEIDRENNIATVDFGGVQRQVIIAVEDINVGDIVLVHAGLIISKLDEKELEEYKKLIEEFEKAIESQEEHMHQEYLVESS
ncbi:MAG: HypC/HybG/HupF family hydrogenase formation chaperone [Crenarchaeota archaeon]|nr:HypC/HybG/HupF family hydrogenase formation chaperone [Thermoproteota archaeon]